MFSQDSMKDINILLDENRKLTCYPGTKQTNATNPHHINGLLGPSRGVFHIGGHFPTLFIILLNSDKN